jgi:hypothetical protein
VSPALTSAHAATRDFPRAKQREQREGFGVQHLVVDHVVLAIHGEVGGDFAALCVARDVGLFAQLHAVAQLVHGVMDARQHEARVHHEARSLPAVGRHRGEFCGVERGHLRAVEHIDEGGFVGRELPREGPLLFGKSGIFRRKRGHVCAQLAQRGRARRVSVEVRVTEELEPVVAQHIREPGVVLAQRVDVA